MAHTVFFEMPRRRAVYRPTFDRPQWDIKAGTEVQCYVLGFGPYQFINDGEAEACFIVELMDGRVMCVDPDHIQFNDEEVGE